MLFETRYVALFDCVLIKSQISLVSQREVESMKKLMLFLFYRKACESGCGSGEKYGGFKATNKFYLYNIIFNTKNNNTCSFK